MKFFYVNASRPHSDKMIFQGEIGLLRYSEVIGKPVLHAGSGAVVGAVKDIVFCPGLKRIKAFLLERKGLKAGSRTVPMENVLHLGKDAVVIDSLEEPASLKGAGQPKEPMGSARIKGLKIYTRSGQDLGVVNDILIDEKTGAIEGVEVSDGLFQDLLQGRSILPLFGKVEFGQENILVDKEAADELISNGGGLKERFFDRTMKTK